MSERVKIGDGQIEIQGKIYDEILLANYSQPEKLRTKFAFLPNFHWWIRFWKFLQLIFKGECYLD